MVFAGLALALALPSAEAVAGAYDVRVVGGELNSAGDRATLTVALENTSGVALRFVALTLQYDSAAGATLTFDSSALDLQVAPGATEEQTAEFTVDDAMGEYVDWSNPYTIEAAVGADVAAILDAVERVGTNADRILNVLADVRLLSPLLRRSRDAHAARIESLSDWTAWFDWEAIGGFQIDLELGLCNHLGRRIRNARGARRRADTYYEVTRTLTEFDLYPDCMEREDRVAAAQALVGIDRAQDALVLTERDDDGNVLEDWQDVYIIGRFALADQTIPNDEPRMFGPPLQSLNELARLAPEHNDLPNTATALLQRTAQAVDGLVAERREMDAMGLVESMRERFADHPQTVRATTAISNALLAYSLRMLEDDRTAAANNAWVRGHLNLEGVASWDAVSTQLQAARSSYFLTQARASLAAGSLEDAQEALDEAARISPLSEADRNELVNGLFAAHWAELDQLIGEFEFDEVMAVAARLERENAESVAAMAEEQAEMYLRVAEGIWNHYGIMAGIASRNMLDVAEDALERGRSADPERADSLATSFLLARWLFPCLLFGLILIGGLVVVLKGKWRSRGKARRLWRNGLAMADKGQAGKGAALMDRAYELLTGDQDPGAVVGEDSRGHMVLRAARVQLERGRKDRVKEWQSEWRTLEDWERPFSQDFDEALDSFTA